MNNNGNNNGLKDLRQKVMIFARQGDRRPSYRKEFGFYQIQAMTSVQQKGALVVNGD